MFESVQFVNLRVLRDATLPLGPFTLLVGPNASGKSTALLGLHALSQRVGFDARKLYSLTAAPLNDPRVEVRARWSAPVPGAITTMSVSPFSGKSFMHLIGNTPLQPEQRQQCELLLSRIRLFRFDPIQLATAVQLVPNFELDVNGLGLPGVLDRLRDEAPERFESLNAELGEWFPEYDRILFETPQPGFRTFLVRARASARPIPASELSEGTLLGIALLTLAHLENPPSMVLIEEPERGIHPRLLRRVQDALYRLAYPQSAGEKRPAVQVVATTHSPYFLDLFREHPEEVVIAERRGAEAQFQRLVDRPDFEQILEGAPLGEIWYSGVLGGVPVGS